MELNEAGIGLIGAGVFSAILLITEKIMPDPAWFTQAGEIALAISFPLFTGIGLVIYFYFGEPDHV